MELGLRRIGEQAVKWNLLSQQQPLRAGSYLVYDMGSMTVAYWYDSSRTFHVDRGEWDVTHWMVLPDPPANVK